ncbi:glycosyltransferase [Candidatus Saccharibacteria bacterium]|nr:glycosyltransferase [Candidatus Saccharibacteria bacterium]MBR3144248.1 glycosyltransferase [Candidatus Saccharibacteria bacterium]
MMAGENLKKKIKELEKENNFLRRENKYLKTLTNSKRFKFAEKVATAYNGVFPKNTKRRDALERVGGVSKKAMAKREAKRKKKMAEDIALLAKDYKKVIVLNSVPWDLKLKQRPHHLADEFSKLGYFVIYLEYDNVLKDFRVIKENLITVNTEEYLTKLPKACTECYFLSPNNMPTKFSILKKMVDGGYKFIYDYLDEFHEDISGDLSIQMEVWDNLKELKPVVCLTTAKRLYNELKKHLGKNQKVIMASNAVVVEHFDFEKNRTKTPPVDLASMVKKKKPIIGFYGALAPWIDFDLLNKVAKNHPEWEFVYLGVDYNGAAIDLKTMPNVHNLGAKNYEQLPRYAKYFNVAIIPFKCGEIAKATSPVKLFEYMAGGLPTVCTRDLKECEGYEFVYMSKDDDDFEKNLAIAIKDYGDNSKREKLLEQAKENTWSKRVRTISKNLVG